MTAINPELSWSHEEHQRADIIDMLKAQLWASGAYGENYEQPPHVMRPSDIVAARKSNAQSMKIKNKLENLQHRS